MGDHAPYREFQQLQIRNGLDERTDMRGSEEGKWGRPCLVISNPAMHHNDLFMACMITHANDRSSRGYLRKIKGVYPCDVLDRGPNFIDLQQVWTFPAERDAAGNLIGRLDPASQEEATLRELKAILARASEERRAATAVCGGAPIPGQVVFVELLGDSADSSSDQFAIHRCLESAGHQWLADPTTRIACLVIASPAATAPRAGPGPLTLISAIPLIHHPAFSSEHEDNPHVACRLANGTISRLAALTQVIMTVDYGPHRGRVYDCDGTLESWLVDQRELARVIDEVAIFWGVGG